MASIKSEGHEVLYTPLYPPQHLLPATEYVHRYQQKHLIKGLEITENIDIPTAVELARRASAKPAEEKRFKCAHCAKSFKRNDHLKRHTLTQHTDTLVGVYPRLAAEKPFKCVHCDKAFKRNDILKRHTMTQHADTLAGSELWRAKRLNSEERAFKCCQCDSWYKRNDHLKRHVLSAHTDSPQSLVAHEQMVHGITPAPRLPCPHCEVTFKRRDHMIRHVNSKHLNQVVNCPLCPSMYKRRDHLIRHLREKHKTSLTPHSSYHPSIDHSVMQPEVQISC